MVACVLCPHAQIPKQNLIQEAKSASSLVIKHKQRAMLYLICLVIASKSLEMFNSMKPCFLMPILIIKGLSNTSTSLLNPFHHPTHLHLTHYHHLPVNQFPPKPTYHLRTSYPLHPTPLNHNHLPFPFASPPGFVNHPITSLITCAILLYTLPHLQLSLLFSSISSSSILFPFPPRLDRAFLLL